jgi:hypothetical protein
MGFALHPKTFYENLDPRQISFECDIHNIIVTTKLFKSFSIGNQGVFVIFSMFSKLSLSD